MTLFVFAGLPGTGKTTLSRHLARERRAVHLRIDTIEAALGGSLTGPEGYVVGYQVAADNLRLGLEVVADSVNPLQLTRDAWRNVASSTGATLVEIEVVCSDTATHRIRFESRPTESVGQRPMTWADVVARAYEPWDRPPLQIDTAGKTVEESVAALLQRLADSERRSL